MAIRDFLTPTNVQIEPPGSQGLLLTSAALAHVGAPTLLLVGNLDRPVIDLNRHALDRLHREAELMIVPGAGHLFEEPGTLDEVVRHAKAWFLKHLAGPAWYG